MTEKPAPKFVSQAEFARHRGVSRKAVTTWKSKGLLVIDAEGRVDVEATEWKLDDRPANYRGGVTHRPIRAPNGNNFDDRRAKPASATRPGTKPSPRPTDGAPDPADFDLDDPNLPIAEAVRRKENFLGLQRKHEFEVSQKEWVRVEEAGRQVEQAYSVVRDRVLAMPGKLAASLVGLSRAEIEDAIRTEVCEALAALHGG